MSIEAERLLRPYTPADRVDHNKLKERLHALGTLFQERGHHFKFIDGPQPVWKFGLQQTGSNMRVAFTIREGSTYLQYATLRWTDPFPRESEYFKLEYDIADGEWYAPGSRDLLGYLTGHIIISLERAARATSLEVR